MDYPVDVDDSETIVRVLKSPHHLNPKGKLKAAAFKPPRGSDETSVIRWRYVTEDTRELKELVRRIGSGPNTNYVGVAHLLAVHCTTAQAGIRDSRHLFQGHADLVFPVKTPGHDDPPEGDAHAIVFAITDQLAKAATTLRDPDPESPEWSIAELPVPSNR